jgi:hypothetical protein
MQTNGDKVNEQLGKITGVSIISVGAARGHFDKEGRQVMVDKKTIEQVGKYAKALGSIKVRADHGSGVFSTIGYIDNVSQTEDQVFGDLSIYDSEDERDKLFEIAHKKPEHLGLSLEFDGEDEISGDTRLARCDSITAVALVSDPAANKSLYSAKPFNTVSKESACINHKDNIAKQYTAMDTTTQDKKDEKKPDAKVTPAVSDKTPKAGAAKEEVSTETAEKADPAADAVKRFEALEARMNAYEAFVGYKADTKDPAAPGAGDAGKTTPPVTDPSIQPTAQNPDKDKLYSANLEAAAQMGAERAIKHFAAQLGVKPLEVGTAAVSTVKDESSAKQFSALVTAKTAELKGDKVAATLFCIQNHKKEYAASRQIALKK